MRKRGHVARIHIITKMTPTVLAMKYSGPSAGTADANGPRQPPRNRVVVMADTANRLPYSAM